LCHQHSYVSTAALPAFPLLVHGLDVLSAELVVEVLDILYGFAVCTGHEPLESLPDWQQKLRGLLLAESARFQTLKQHPNEDIRGFATLISDALDTPFWKRRGKV